MIWRSAWLLALIEVIVIVCVGYLTHAVTVTGSHRRGEINMVPIDNWDDRIDSRNVLTRIDELVTWRDGHDGDDTMEALWEDDNPDEASELAKLTKLIDELRDGGYAGDTPEDGIHLVRESDFSDYIKEMYLDCMGPEQTQLMQDLPWSCIDWSEVAEECRSDYTTIEFDGVTYYYR